MISRIFKLTPGSNPLTRLIRKKKKEESSLQSLTPGSIREFIVSFDKQLIIDSVRPETFENRAEAGIRGYLGDSHGRSGKNMDAWED